MNELEIHKRKMRSVVRGPFLTLSQTLIIKTFYLIHT